MQNLNQVNEAYDESFKIILQDCRLPEPIVRMFFHSFGSARSAAWHIESGAIIFTVVDHPVFTARIILTKAVFSMGSLKPDASLIHVEVEKSMTGYGFSFLQTSGSDKEEIKLICQNITGEINLWDYRRACPLFNQNSLLNKLYNLSGAIILKTEILGDEFLNDQEKDLQPIARYVEETTRNDQADAKSKACAVRLDHTGLDRLLQLAQETKSPDIPPILQDIGAAQTGQAQKAAFKRLRSAFTQAQNEAFVIALIDRFGAGAAPYKNKYETFVPLLRQVQIAELVTHVMKSRGFTGKYPNFRQESELNGFHVLLKNEMPHFHYHERSMNAAVYCRESVSRNHIHLDFICSTVFLRDNERDKRDQIRSETAFFNDYVKGKRYGRILSFTSGSSYDSYNLYEEINKKVPAYATAAAKMALQARLDKNERAFQASSGSLAWAMPLFCLATGLVLGLFMTAGLVVLAFLLGLLITGNFQDTLKEVALLSDYAVKICFIGGGGAYGLILCLLIVWSKNATGNNE
ncbi:MAG: DUF3878 family protein [Clostridiaceae bacterium]|nr:DUF3878 family protein [Clostridiaceae bacterium]